MPRIFKYAIIFALLIISLTELYSQDEKIRVDIAKETNLYATTMRSDTILARSILNSLIPLRDKMSVSEMMIQAGKKILGKSYVAATLDDEKDVEELKVFLNRTDCILFVETCFNLSLCVKKYGSEANFNRFAFLVSKSRYRDGVVKNYSDRIHYTTEWIIQQQKRGLLNDITRELGGILYDHPIYYMSKNYNRYLQLKDANPDELLLNRATEDLKKIIQVEKEISSYPFYYIPQEKIPQIENKIENGDIICYITKVEGLDIAHVAMAYKNNGRVGFIHASIGDMKVVVDSKSIYQYVKANKSIIGIKVVRPNGDDLLNLSD